MASKYDCFYLIYINNGLSISDLVKKLNKTKSYYKTTTEFISDLLKDNLIIEKDKKYYLSETKKTRHLLEILNYCISNKIDYNELFLPTTIEFIKLGLEENLDKLEFNPRTIKRISNLLSKHGFLLIESSKPYKAQIVYSLFLELLVNYFYSDFECKKLKIFALVNEDNINKQLNSEFSKYKKKSKGNISYEINFIHQSLSLEGNTLTLPETEKLILKNIPPKNKSFKDMLDVSNYKKALDYLLDIKTPLNIDNILKFHNIAMQSLSKGNGIIRKQNVEIRGNPHYKTEDWRLLPNRINNFFEYYSQSINIKMKADEIVNLSADLHSEFQRIHPFVDGNSRTSRAIFVHTLILKGFPIIEFLPGFVDQYMGLTKLSKERNDNDFKKLMKIIVLESLKKVNKKAEYS
jgi:prophage maintenance system killer protein